jgi:hypothetical protein
MKTAIFVTVLALAIANAAGAQPAPQGQPAQGRGQRPPADPRNRGGGNCIANPYKGEIGRKIVEMRATNTVAAIKKAVADRRKQPSAQ